MIFKNLFIDENFIKIYLNFSERQFEREKIWKMWGTEGIEKAPKMFKKLHINLVVHMCNKFKENSTVSRPLEKTMYH